MKPTKETLRAKCDINHGEAAAILERRCTAHDAEVTEDVLEATAGRKAVVMGVCVFLVMCAFGLPTALGVIYAEIITALDVPRDQAALVQSLCTGGSLAGGVFLTGPIQKYGSGKCVILASVVGTMAMTLAFFATNILTLIVSVGVVTGLALSVLLLAGFVAVGQIFTTHKRVAIAALTLGATIGQSALPNITQVLIYLYNWNGAILVLSAIALLNCIPCGVILWCSEQHLSSEVSDKTKGTQQLRVCECLGDLAFVLFIVTTFFSRLCTPLEHFFTVDLAVMKGFSATEGAGLLAMNGWFSIIGRIILTSALKCFPNTPSDFHLGYGFVLCGIGNFLVISASTYWTMFLAISAHGICYGLVLSIMPVMKLDIRGPELYVESMAICNLVIGLANTISGYLGGLSVELTGSYRLMFYIVTVVLIVSGFSMAPIYFIRKRKQKLETSNVPYEELK